MKSFSGWLATALLAAGLATGSGTLGPWRNVLSLPLGSRVLTAVSCPSSRVCEAVGVTASRVYDLTLRSTDGGRSWSARTLPAGTALGNSVGSATPDGEPENALACPTADRCVTFGREGNKPNEVALVTSDAGVRWATAPLPGNPTEISGVACPSRTECVAVGTGPGGTWALRSADGGARWVRESLPAGAPALLAVSCPTTAVCVAVGGGAIRSTDGGRTWRLEGRLSSDITVSSLACASPTVCIAVGNTPSSAAAARTTDGGEHWTERSLAGSGLETVSCGSRSVCEAVGFTYGNGCCAAEGAVAFHTTNAGASWRPQALPKGTLELDGVSCPALASCRAVGYAGSNAYGEPAVLSGTADYLAPGIRKWARGRVPVGILSLWGSACASTLCQVFGDNTAGSAVAYRIIDGSTWRPDTLPKGLRLEAVSCSTASRCVALAQDRDVAVALVSSDAGRAWTMRKLPAAMAYGLSMSCPTSSRCAAFGQERGGATVPAVSHDGGLAWRAGPVVRGVTPFIVDCPTGLRCYGLGGDASLVSTDGGLHWRRAGNPGIDYFSGLACPAEGDCVAAGYDHVVGVPPATVARTTDGGASWDALTLPGDGVLTGVGCSSVEDCVATDSDATIWRTTDGGSTWQKEAGGTSVITLDSGACSRRICVVTAESASRAIVRVAFAGRT